MGVSPRLLLQSGWAIIRLSKSLLPPCDRGMTWSSDDPPIPIGTKHSQHNPKVAFQTRTRFFVNFAPSMTQPVGVPIRHLRREV